MRSWEPKAAKPITWKSNVANWFHKFKKTSRHTEVFFILTVKSSFLKNFGRKKVCGNVIWLGQGTIHLFKKQALVYVKPRQARNEGSLALEEFSVTKVQLRVFVKWTFVNTVLSIWIDRNVYCSAYTSLYGLL